MLIVTSTTIGIGIVIIIYLLIYNFCPLKIEIKDIKQKYHGNLFKITVHPNNKYPAAIIAAEIFKIKWKVKHCLLIPIIGSMLSNTKCIKNTLKMWDCELKSQTRSLLYNENIKEIRVAEVDSTFKILENKQEKNQIIKILQSNAPHARRFVIKHKNKLKKYK